MSTALTILVNAADILILAFVIYKILILLKNHRAMQLVKGIVVLVLLYFVSGWLHLDTVHFLLAQGWSVVAIGIIIIFQPELRSLLEHLGGKGNLLNLQPKPLPKERIIAEVTKTLSTAATSKTGVILIFEGKTGLREYIETGIPVEGIVSHELLRNLFSKNAPLHDGAVIIRKNRIAAAGCIMPLTTNPYIDPALGTRHRAALGISEVSDALALVVSEENGRISVARAGKLQRHVSLETAESIMREFFGGGKKSKQQKIRRRREPS
jgi:diadenylate cyclase